MACGDDALGPFYDQWRLDNGEEDEVIEHENDDIKTSEIEQEEVWA